MTTRLALPSLLAVLMAWGVLAHAAPPGPKRQLAQMRESISQRVDALIV